MEEMKRVVISGKAIPVRGNDIDTDRIIPARYLRCVTFDGLGEHAFEDDRRQLAGKGQTHPFDNARYADATILFVNKNFGCGSSREHAPQSIMRWGPGIRAIVGESFAEIFFGNCVTLGVPALVVDEAGIQRLMETAEEDPAVEFTLDIEKKVIAFNGETVPVKLADGPRQLFLEGRWDSTAELLAAVPRIKETAAALPYMNGWQ